MNLFKKIFYAFGCVGLLVTSVGVQPVYAASIVVNSNADTIANDGACTLREAIINANNDDTSGSTDCAAGAGADVISFDANYTITLVGSQLPTITTQININGNGATNTIIQANVAPNTATYRVFEVSSTGILTLDGLTVRHGRCNGACSTFDTIGGGIFSEGEVNILNSSISNNTATVAGGGIYHSYQYSEKLTIEDSTLTYNTSSNNGGAVFTNGIMEVNNSTFENNTAFSGGAITKFGIPAFAVNNSIFYNNTTTQSGGAIFFWVATNATVIDNVFSQNRAGAGMGGGVYNDANSPTFTNNTFYNNSAGFGGGGMANFNGSAPTITNVTFSGNSALYGGGMYNYNGSSPTLTNVTFSGNTATNTATNGGGGMFNYWMNSSPTLRNIIIANSVNGGDCVMGSHALNPSSSNNLIEDAANACGLTNGVNGNIIGQDPNLGPLADNGGDTQTHALLSGSPAIDTGASCPSTDQRGISRPQGGGCDIGAFELDDIFPTVVSDSLVASYASGAGPSNFTVTFSENVYDPAGDTDPDDVTNPDNYLIVETGANGVFNTVSCTGGVASDDVQATLTSVTYNAGLFTATVNLSGALLDGSYRLFVCGTTSIVDLSLNELNDGISDYTFDFIVGAVTTTAPPVTASALPDTGFAPHKVTTLPHQPAELAYTAMSDIWLEIPSQNIKTNIVGIPQSQDNTWDVTWLGNDTGWLNGTAFPTWNGNSVLTAHTTDSNGLPGPFANLKTLKYGDQIIVHLFGQQYVYEVQNSRMVRPYTTNFAFTSLQDHSYLTLITCQGYIPFSDTYLFRRVIRAVLVDVK